MAQEVENTTIEEQFHSEALKSDFGKKIEKNKFVLGGVILLFLLGGLAYGWWTSSASEKAIESQNMVYEFETSTMKQLADGKIELSDAVESFHQLENKIDSQSRLLLSAEQLVKKLEATDALKAKDFLKGYWEKLKDSQYAKELMGFRLLGLFEQTKDYQSGIEVLNTLVASPNNPKMAYSYLNLGRFHQKLEQNEEASRHFNHIVEKFPETQEAKMAKVYLSQL